MADNKLFKADDSGNTPDFNENVVKEQVYTEERDKVQEDINTIKAEEREKAEKPVSKNIFRRMKEAFERNQVDRELERQQKEHIKKEYESKISEARKARKVQEIEQKYKDKLAYENLTSQEKKERTKEKIQKISSTLSSELGSFGKSEFVNTASSSVERNLGRGSSVSGGLPDSSRIAGMMGGRNTGAQKTVGKGSGDMFSTQHIGRYLSSNKPSAETNTLRYLPKPNIGGAATRAGKLLGAAPTGRNYESYFGKSNVNIMQNLPKQNPKKELIKRSGPNNAFEREIFGSAVPNKTVKGKVIEMEPENSTKSKINKMLGKI